MTELLDELQLKAAEYQNAEIALEAVDNESEVDCNMAVSRVIADYNALFGYVKEHWPQCDEETRTAIRKALEVYGLTVEVVSWDEDNKDRDIEIRVLNNLLLQGRTLQDVAIIRYEKADLLEKAIDSLQNTWQQFRAGEVLAEAYHAAVERWMNAQEAFWCGFFVPEEADVVTSTQNLWAKPTR